MNRIQLSAQKKSPASSQEAVRSAGESAALAAPGSQSLFVPLHYEPNYAYPLLVWLHGAGDCHRQLKQVMPHISMRNYVGVAPAMPRLDTSPGDCGSGDCDPADGRSGAGNQDRSACERRAAGGAPRTDEESADATESDGLRWESLFRERWADADGWEDSPSGADWQQSPAMIAATMDAVEAAIARATARCHVSPSRIFLAGVDAGGTMALRLALNAPERFAGVASVGGPLPRGLQPMSNLLRARRMPVWIAHGRDSESYTEHRLCDELRLFHVAGMSLNVRQYPCGQEVTTQMLSDLNAWVMQIVTGVDMSSDASSQRGSYLPKTGEN